MEARFAEVEKRIHAMLERNERLSGRVEELERELAEARKGAADLRQASGKTDVIRQRVEQVLRELESLGKQRSRMDNDDHEQ
jgi:cell division septum initiation protein DivIVA